MNAIKCKNCSAENPFYELICRNCKSYIRERIFNIDLFQTISRLIESPSSGYSSIIHAEHKNFVFLISFLASLKFLINSMLLSQVTIGAYNPFEHFIRNIFIIFPVTLALIALFSLLEKTLFNRLKNDTRFKDNFTVLSFSLLPHVFGLIILFPIELVVFGGFLFSNNPSPFMLKETVAYMLLGFEVLLILWQLFLTTSGFYIQSRRLLLSVLFSLIFNLLLYYILYLFSYLII